MEAKKVHSLNTLFEKPPITAQTLSPLSVSHVSGCNTSYLQQRSLASTRKNYNLDLINLGLGSPNIKSGSRNVAFNPPKFYASPSPSKEKEKNIFPIKEVNLTISQ